MGHGRAHGNGVARFTNHAHGFGGAADGIGGKAVGIGKCGFFARHGAHAHALIDLEAARFDHAFFQMPAFKGGALAIDVGIVHMVSADKRERAGKFGIGKVVWGEQML